MMWGSKWYGALGVLLGALVWVAPVSRSVAAPRMLADARLRVADELREDSVCPSEEKCGEATALADWTAPTVDKLARSEVRAINEPELRRQFWNEDGHAEEALVEGACKSLEEEPGRQSTDLAACLNSLGEEYWAKGMYKESGASHMQALVIREQVLGSGHLDVAESLNGLAMSYLKIGQYEKAQSLYERALVIRESELGPEHLDVAESLHNLGELRNLQGKDEEAEVLYERALAIREKLRGPEHPDVATTLNNLAVVYEGRGEYVRSELLRRRTVDIFRRALGEGHPHYATSLNNLAMLYQAQGNYEKARPLFEQAAIVFEKALGPRHPDVALSLNNLAMLCQAQGRYEEAELLHERALVILENALGSNHFLVAQSLNNLALMYKNRGEYERAEPLFRQTLAMREDSLGRDHPHVAVSLQNLAGLYQARGEHNVAEPLLKRALHLKESALGSEHPDVAASLNNLAVLYQMQGEYGKAEPLFGRALEIWTHALGPDHVNVATALSNLALLHCGQGDYDTADPLFERALTVFGSAFTPDHPDVAVGLRNMAACYHDQGNHDPALQLHRRALDIQEAILVRTLTVSGEARRLSNASTLTSSLNYVLSLHLRVAPQHDTIADLALTTLLRRKNRVQELVAQTTAALRRSLPEDARHILDDLSDVDSQIAVLSSRGPGKVGGEEYAQQIDELRRQRDGLWSELAKYSALVEALNHPITIEDVQRALPSSSALIELARYVPHHDEAGVRLRDHETKPPPRYAAYLVFPDRFDWVDLGPAAPIDEQVRALRMALQTKQAVPTDLYDAVIRPIAEKLGSTHRLIIAPAGDLSLIPFGALHDGKRYLIEQYDLRYVTTGRDLLDPPASPPVTTTPVTIVANPTGANLPDAELEADFLASFFPHTRVLLDEQATETNVRTVERPFIFHLATHGFFGEALNERDNPLFRSGLYLADIDQVQVDRERDDGQLTAYEVSGMDLRGTQLAVLSACETGLGAAVKAEGKELMSEGVAGLRRAFAMAGAQTTVMSLWEVSGVTAQKTMEAYYRKLAEGMGRGEAMQAVQLEMLRSEEHAHPKDWAAFIVSGDDDPINFPIGQEPRLEAALPEPLGPPPVRQRHGCTIGAPSPGHDTAPGTDLLALLGLITLRRQARRLRRSVRLRRTPGFRRPRCYR